MRKGGTCKFPGCKTVGTKTMPMRRGMCNKHRKWREKGIIDDNCNILQPDKVPAGRQYTHCKMAGCLGKHKAKGFCLNHYKSYRAKKLSINGEKMYFRQERGKLTKCKVRNCERDGRIVRGFCRHHYQKFQRKQIDIHGFEVHENTTELFTRIYNKKRKRH
jgi:hypothetical protein